MRERHQLNPVETFLDKSPIGYFVPIQSKGSQERRRSGICLLVHLHHVSIHISNYESHSFIRVVSLVLVGWMVEGVVSGNPVVRCQQQV